MLGGQRTDIDAVRDALPDLLVLEREGEVIACCALTPGDEHAYFGMFAVRPGLQGGGVGSRLLAAAEARARELGKSRIEMTVIGVRSELIAYYERRGYAATGEKRPFPYGDERFGEPRRDDLEFVVLAKSL